MRLPYFGDVTLADGAVVVMDGGTHGVQGHTLEIAPSGDGTWQRRLDGFRPSGKAGAGRVELTPDEAERLRRWSDELWALASAGGPSLEPPSPSGPPRWVFAIVLRREDEVRVVQGGGVASPSGAPNAARPMLEWLVRRVDELSAG